MRELQPGDIVRLKADSHDRRFEVVGIAPAIGTHYPEAHVRIIGESWVRNFKYRVSDLIPEPADLEDFKG
jgi:hypothetical protein